MLAGAGDRPSSTTTTGKKGVTAARQSNFDPMLTAQTRPEFFTGTIEAAKAIPVAGAVVGFGERVVAEATRNTVVPPTQSQTHFCNFAALADEVINPAPQIEWQLGGAD